MCLVASVKHWPYEECLEVLKLPSLFYQHRRGNMIQVYQIIHGGVDLSPDEFFAPAASDHT